MPKRANRFSAPVVHLDATLPTPLYQQVYERFRQAILSGQLAPGARLPSTRQLASELGISRSTTALAYQQLLLEGYLDSRVGQGTTVAQQVSLPWLIEDGQRAKVPTATPPAVPLHLATQVPTLRALPAQSLMAQGKGGYFQAGVPALDLFPYALWARLIARRARQSLSLAAGYQDPAGYPSLRAAIATHIGITRGVHCTPEQIIITAGSQGALDLAARTLLNPGDDAWVENPGYDGARGALLAARAQLIPVPVDNEGINVAIGRQLSPMARLASTTPSHQFPTGVTMSRQRRLQLLAWAHQAQAWVLEDDYDSEYRFTGRPLESLQGVDQHGRVLYIGTFSKVLFPALRLGYLVAPLELVDPLLTVRRFIDTQVPIVEQLALNDFLNEGHYGRHVRQMLGYYRQRRDRLQQALHMHLGQLIDVAVPEAGMHLVGWLPPGMDDQQVAQAAARNGVAVSPLSQYSSAALPRGGLLFGYAHTPEQDIEPGIQRLAAVLARR